MDAEARRRAARYVVEQLGRRRQDEQWLVRVSGLDPATVTDFLRGDRWPRSGTRSKIEDALNVDRGTLTLIADGWGAASQEDPIEAAIEASTTLTRAQKLRLRAVYVEMIEGAEGVNSA